MTPKERSRLVLPRETERLVLRAPSPTDAAIVQQAVEETFESLRRWMPWAAQWPSLEQTTAFLREAQRSFEAGEDFAVSGYLKETGEFVLGSGLHPRNWSVPRFEIGYWCRASRQGQGYTAETVQALTRLAFLEMKAERVEIRCDSRNLRSARVAQRAGFRLEASLRSEDRATDGSLRDTLVYACVRAEWSAGLREDDPAK
jgi:RimJ/RimL family protein N-acetyltransferase